MRGLALGWKVLPAVSVSPASFRQSPVIARWVVSIHSSGECLLDPSRGHWTPVAATCPVMTKTVACGQQPGTLPLATFLKGIFGSILSSPSCFHQAPPMGGPVMGAPCCHML